MNPKCEECKHSKHNGSMCDAPAAVYWLTRYERSISMSSNVGPPGVCGPKGKLFEPLTALAEKEE